MSNDTIKISTFELEECNGNMQRLSDSWHEMPMLDSSPLSASKGNAAVKVGQCLLLFADIQKCMGDLLQNTSSYFKSVGVSFKDADEKSSAHIDSLTN